MTNEDSYEDASEEALKRDGYTCQLCGMVGYPKTEHGLAAVPVEPDQHQPKSLVTVCHECLKKDDVQLKNEVQEAYERRQRRTPNTSGNPQSSRVNSESDSQQSSMNRLRSTGRRLREYLRSVTAPEFTDENETDGLISRIGQKDNFNCQVCGAVLRPRGRVSYTVRNLRGDLSQDNEVDNNVSVCFDCLDWKDENVVAHEANRAGQLKNAQRGLTLLYAKSALCEFREKVRLFIHSGQLVILRRAIAASIGLTGLLVAGVLLAGLLGALFISPQSGISWAQAALESYQTVGIVLLVTPWVALGTLGVGYIVHVYELERAYERELFRDERRRGETPSVGHGRPRWQFVASFAVVGLFGAVDWILVRHNVFPDGMLFGALVFWTAGSAGVAYYLRVALREDRDIDGQPVNPAPWVFASRYVLFVALVGAVTSSLNAGSFLSPAILELTLILPSLVGALYVGRRLAEQRTVWGARTMYSIRSVIDKVWSLDDDWPPTERNRQQPNTDDRDTNNS